MVKLNNLEEFWDAVDSAIDDGISGTWRWGTERWAVFKRNGKAYMVNYRHQPEWGVEECIDFPIECPEVVEVEVIQRDWQFAK